MSYYQELQIHIREKVKVLLDMSNYATKNLNDGTSVGISNLVAKRHFNALKAEFENLSMNILVNIPTEWNNFKEKVNCLDADKL